MAPKPRPTGKRGSAVHVSHEGKVLYEDQYTEPLVFGDEMSLPEHPATVGISIAVGDNAGYGQKKVEVTAWCTLPCGHSEEERQVAQDACALDVMEELDRRLDEVTERYFPELEG